MYHSSHVCHYYKLIEQRIKTVIVNSCGVVTAEQNRLLGSDLFYAISVLGYQQVHMHELIFYCHSTFYEL